MPNDKEKALIALRTQWYAKLKADGFDDIETFSPHELEPNHRLRGEERKLAARLARPLIYDTTSEYYRQAGIFYWGANWRGRPMDKKVWELRKEGASIREIERAMGWRSRKKTFAIVKRLEAEMKRFNANQKADP